MNFQELQNLSESVVAYVRLSEPIIDYTSVPSGIFIIADYPGGQISIPLENTEICSIVELFLFPKTRRTMTWEIKQLFSYLRYNNKNFDHKPDIVELQSLSFFCSSGEKPTDWRSALTLFKSLSSSKAIKYHDEVLSHLSSYVLPKLDIYPISDKLTGRRILACYHPEGAVNGRLSATSPSSKFYNPLNMPKDYRSKLLPTCNSTLIQMDYKAMELVTAAYLSKDKNLLLAVEQEDPYLAIFQMAFGSYQDKEQARERAKDIILPLIYGSGKKKLAMALGVEESVAEGAEKAIWRTFRDLQEWLAIKESEACSGSVIDSIGRVRNFPTETFKSRHHCISSPSVGHCLDRLCRLAEDDEIKLVLNIHDAFVFEVEKNDKKILNKIKDILVAPSVFVEGAKYNISISSF